MEIPLDETVYFDVITSDPSTGNATDADSAPVFDVFEEATDTPIVSAVSMTKRTSKTGNYRGSFVASAANGFELGKWYSAVVSATVNGFNGKVVAKNFRLVAAENSAGFRTVDISKIKGTDSAGTAGYTGPDWGQVANKTSTNALTATTIATTQQVDVNTIKTQTVTCAAGVTVPALIASTTNITAGTVTTATNVTTVNGLAANVITATSINADAITAAKVADGAIDAATFASNALDAVWSTAARTLTAGTNIQLPSNGLANISSWTIAITGNITGNLSGSVGSVTGNMGGNVVGSVASVATGGIVAASFATGAITAAAIAADAIGASELAADAVAEIQSGLSTLDAATVATAVWNAATASYGSAGSYGLLVETNLDAAVTTRMTTYSQPTGFLAATFPTGTIANTTNISTVATVNSVSGNVAGSVGSVTGNLGGDVEGNLLGSIGSLATQAKTDVTSSVDAWASGIGLTDTVVGRISTIWSKLPVNNMGDQTLLIAAIGSPMQAGATVALTDYSETWKVLTSAVTTSGSFGKLLKDNINSSLSGIATNATTAAGASLSANGKLGTPVVDVSADIATRAAPGDAMTLTSGERNSIATALLDLADGVETSVTLRKALRGIASALLGKLSGAGTGTEIMRNATDSKNRITATVDSDGNRSAITLDLT